MIEPASSWPEEARPLTQELAVVTIQEGKHLSAAIGKRNAITDAVLVDLLLRDQVVAAMVDGEFCIQPSKRAFR